MFRCYRRVALSAAALSLTGCCDFFLYLCGPDSSPWPERSYKTPEDAIATFKEALRRENTEELYLAVSERFKEQMGGVDYVMFEEVWPEIVGDQPVYMLGHADVTEVERTAESVKYEFEVGGYRFHVGLALQRYWEYAYQRELPDGTFETKTWSRYVRESAKVEQMVDISDDGIENVVTVVLPGNSPLELTLDQLRHAGFGSDWKVDSFQPITDVDTDTD